MLSPLLASNHNTGIDSAAILASRFILRRLSSVDERQENRHIEVDGIGDDLL
jgi:hypothetical protein